MEMATHMGMDWSWDLTPLPGIVHPAHQQTSVWLKDGHYQKTELPWRPKTAKEYRKTAKVIVLGSQLPSKIRQE